MAADEMAASVPQGIESIAGLLFSQADQPVYLKPLGLLSPMPPERTYLTNTHHPTPFLRTTPTTPTTTSTTPSSSSCSLPSTDADASLEASTTPTATSQRAPVTKMSFSGVFQIDMSSSFATPAVRKTDPSPRWC